MPESGKENMKIWEPTTLATFLGIQWAAASRIAPPSEKAICISTKKQAQCESGSGYQVGLALKTVRLG